MNSEALSRSRVSRELRCLTDCDCSVALNKNDSNNRMWNIAVSSLHARLSCKIHVAATLCVLARVRMLLRRKNGPFHDPRPRAELIIGIRWAKKASNGAADMTGREQDDQQAKLRTGCSS